VTPAEEGSGPTPLTGVVQNRPMDLTVRVTGRDAEDHIAVPEGTTSREELTRFLNRQGPYAKMWIRLASGEYVRYEHILSVSEPPDAAA
jgi:hypothetical protein